MISFIFFIIIFFFCIYKTKAFDFWLTSPQFYTLAFFIYNFKIWFISIKYTPKDSFLTVAPLSQTQFFAPLHYPFSLHNPDPSSVLISHDSEEKTSNILYSIYSMIEMKGVSMGWPCVDMHLPYLTCYLQMTLYCFVGLLKGRCRLLLNCCRHMQMPQDNALILIIPLSISLQTQAWTKGRELRLS